METIKQKRRESNYFRIAALVVAEVTKAAPFWPTVTAVKLSQDRSHLTIFMAFERNSADGIAALETAKGFVRTQIAQHTSQRIAPHVHFVLDTSEDAGRRIDAIINALNKKPAPDNS